MKLPFDVAVFATGAAVFERESASEFVNVVTDTRLLQPGDTFLALSGERFDGHGFVRSALAHGAAAVIIDHPEARVEGHTALVVADTLEAYMALAGAARDRFRGKVLAITGSAGKTTTKVFSTQLLATRYRDRVLPSPANENNEIGVSKLLLGASNDAHDVLVVEMGARHYGDIAVLTKIAKPDVSVLTNIGDAHLEIMGSREALEATKWSIFASGARAIVNARDEASVRHAPALERPPHWFFGGADSASVPRIGRITAVLGSERLLDIDGDRTRNHFVRINVPGDHNRANLAAAAAAALELGADVESLADAMEHVELPAGRYQAFDVNGLRMIYDAYNANASSTLAALDTFATEPAERRIALLSSMAELGVEAPQLHRRVGARVAETKVDILLCGGDYADDLALGAINAGFASERVVRFASNAEAAAWLRAHARLGDAVLLKGSRKYKLEEIVEELHG